MKKILSLALIIMLICTTAYAKDDVEIDLEDIRYAYMFGYSPETDSNGNTIIRMGVDDNTTVEEVSTMLMRILDQEKITDKLIFDNMKQTEKYKNEWFYRGISYQYLKGSFDDEQLNLGYITRGQVAKLICKGLNLTKTEATKFQDIADSPYKKYIEIIYNYEYMIGTSRKTFEPDRYMTRGEFCTLFNNILDRDSDYKLYTFENNRLRRVTPEDYHIIDLSPKHWAYRECMKATSAFDKHGFVDLKLRKENIRNIIDRYPDQTEY